MNYSVFSFDYVSEDEMGCCRLCKVRFFDGFIFLSVRIFGGIWDNSLLFFVKGFLLRMNLGMGFGGMI